MQRSIRLWLTSLFVVFSVTLAACVQQPPAAPAEPTTAPAAPAAPGEPTTAPAAPAAPTTAPAAPAAPTTAPAAPAAPTTAPAAPAAPTTAPAAPAAPTTAPAAPTAAPAAPTAAPAAPTAAPAAPTAAPAAPTAAPAAPTTAPAAPAPSGASVSLEIANQGEQLLFNKEELGPVPAGSNVSLTMSNDSIVNPHNWILLNTGDEAEAAAFSQEAATYPADQNHMPPSSDLVLASTSLLNAGANETETVDFSAPAAGNYIYVCTVPGHYDAGMWGYLSVE